MNEMQSRQFAQVNQINSIFFIIRVLIIIRWYNRCISSETVSVLICHGLKHIVNLRLVFKEIYLMFWVWSSNFELNQNWFQNLSKCNCAYGYARDSNGVCIPEHECPEPTPECPMVSYNLQTLTWVICFSRVNILQNANGVPNQLAMNPNGVQNHRNQQVMERSLKAVQSDQCLRQMILLIGSLRIIFKL